MRNIVLFPTNRDYCKECIYNDTNRCTNVNYNRNSYKVNCVWKYCKYKRVMNDNRTS